MNNFSIPPQLLQMMKGKNPQQAIMGILQQNANGNPMLENVMAMMNNQDGKGIETIARNLCKSKGIDADEMFKSIQSQFK